MKDLLFLNVPGLGEVWAQDATEGYVWVHGPATVRVCVKASGCAVMKNHSDVCSLGCLRP